MKELTIEEKAERYDELLVKLQKAKVDNDVCDERYCCVIDDIVPELKESEDEEIRKWIIDDIRYNMNNEPLNNSEYKKKAEKAIAWLEKQGEQKHQYKSRPRYVGEEELLGANKQGEQKSAENEELTEFDKAVGVSIGTWNPKSPEQIQSVKAVSKKLLKLAKKQINDEQKPAEWSEEDEREIEHCIDFLNHPDMIRTTPTVVKGCKNWLKSIKDRVQHQNTCKSSGEHHELEEFAKIVRCNLTGISKSVQQLFEAKYLQLTGNKMYEGFKD